MTTYQDPMKLRGYSKNQLIEELARRANVRDTKQPVHWCHDCTRYLTWVDGKTPNKPMPDDYNACQKHHEMRFIVPEDIGDEYGYYLHVCADRDMGKNVE